jgi:hypothetical protein
MNAFTVRNWATQVYQSIRKRQPKDENHTHGPYNGADVDKIERALQPYLGTLLVRAEWVDATYGCDEKYYIPDDVSPEQLVDAMQLVLVG